MKRAAGTKLRKLVRGGLFLLAFFVLSVSPAPQPVEIILLGDMMLGRGVAGAYPNGGLESALAPLLPVFEKANLVLANLESPLTNAPYAGAGYDLRASPESAPILASWGFDLLSVANNHSLDGGLQGLRETRSVLESAGITPLGPQPAPVYRAAGGLRIAFIAADDVSARLDEETLARAVEQAGKTGALVLVSIHWGWEYQSGPSVRQFALAQRLADAGADLVWGHHPHVLQPVAWVRGAGQNHAALVAYSLGNALFDQLVPGTARQSALLWVRLDRDGVQSVRALPYEIDALRGRVVPAGSQAAAAVLRRLGSQVKPLETGG